MKNVCLILLLIYSTSALGQNTPPKDSTFETHPVPSHIYHVNPWVTGSIIVAGGAADLLALNVVRYKPAITDAEFDGLNTNSINPFDRWALRLSTTNYTKWENIATIYNAAGVFLPLTLFFDEKINKDWFRILAMYVEVESISLTTYIATPLGPLFQEKLRPIVYYDNLSRAERSNGNNRNSFYSGHVASVSAATFFMVKVYSDYHPEIGGDKFWLYAAALVPPLGLGYIRMLGLNHFPSDILTGLGIGALYGVLIPELHRISDKDVSFGVYTSPEATGLSMKIALK